MGNNLWSWGGLMIDCEAKPRGFNQLNHQGWIDYSPINPSLTMIILIVLLNIPLFVQDIQPLPQVWYNYNSHYVIFFQNMTFQILDLLVHCEWTVPLRKYISCPELYIVIVASSCCNMLSTCNNMMVTKGSLTTSNGVFICHWILISLQGKNGFKP